MPQGLCFFSFVLSSTFAAISEHRNSVTFDNPPDIVVALDALIDPHQDLYRLNTRRYNKTQEDRNCGKLEVMYLDVATSDHQVQAV
jgi:hypothetical protein